MKPVSQRGFSLIELLVATLGIATLTSVAIFSYARVTESISERRLEGHVRTINAAIRVYQANGGDLDSISSPIAVIAALKSRLTGVDAAKQVGLTGNMIDPRLAPVFQTESEAATEAPRVLWDAGAGRFVVRYRGAPGIKAFRLNKTATQTDESSPPKKRGDEKLHYAVSDHWVWDYQEAEAATPAPPTTVPFTTGSTGPPPASGSPDQLDPPLFSISGGKHAFAAFDLPLTFTNPNDSTISIVRYKVNSMPWRWDNGTPVLVPPGAVVVAYTYTQDPRNWLESVRVEKAYEAKSVRLKIDLSVPKAVTWAEVGGAMVPGVMSLAPGLPGLITLANATEIPLKYQSSNYFNVFWTYDGTDPLSFIPGVGLAPGVYAGGSFHNGLPGQAVDYSLPVWGYDSKLTIKAAAGSSVLESMESSSVVDETIKVNPMPLRPPVLVAAGSDVTIHMPTAFGDTPVGARVFYTTNGKDPGNDKGRPRGDAILYTGSFRQGANLCFPAEIKASVYGPANYEHWFTPSPVGTVSVQPLRTTDSFYDMICTFRASLCGFSWFVLDGNLEIVGGSASIKGDAAIGPGASANFRKDTVAGKIYVHPGTTGGVPSEMSTDLGDEKTDALAIATGFGDLPPTQQIDQVHNGLVTTGTAPTGLNVIQVRSISMGNHSSWSLMGNAEDWFIVNVTETFDMSAGSQIIIGGSLDPSRVIFNIGPGVGTVSISGNATIFNATILAPVSSVHVTGGARVEGSVISGGASKLSGSTEVLGNSSFGGECLGESGDPNSDPPGPVEKFIDDFTASGLGRFGWFAAGGTVQMHDWENAVIGDVGIGPDTKMNYSKGAITGSFVVDPTVTEKNGALDDIPGPTEGSLITSTVEDLSAYATAAHDLSAQAAALAPTQIIGQITETFTLTGTAPDGFNVIRIETLSLGSGRTFTISGGADDWFIFNISKEFKFSGGAIAVSGVPGNQILFNLLPGASEAKVDGVDFSLDATILAPNSPVDLTGAATVTGAIISGRDASMSGQATIIQTGVFGF